MSIPPAQFLRAALGPDPATPSDDELLRRFAAAHDAGAFELLVWRHAGLVLRVCRSVLHDHHAAEDAAQATFLALARQAAQVGRGSAAGWLFRVARRIAGRAARQQSKNATETGIDLDNLPASDSHPGPDPDAERVLHDELARLPERYRAPVLLCFFEGLSHADAARRLGWPTGTVAGRLARAKEVLARRLSRRGVGVAAVALPVVGGAFVESTARAAVGFGMRANPEVSRSVLELANREVRAMAMKKAFSVCAAVAVCGMMVLGLGLTLASEPAQPADSPAAPKPRVAEAQPAPPGQDVAAAREKAIKYLKSQQTPQGHWEGLVLAYLADMDGGCTALVTLSMLEAGVPADDPAVKKALDYLATLPPKKTYVVSLQTQALAKADAKKYAEQIQKNADWLVDQAIGFKKDGRLEGWSYPGNTVSDNSNTHFAVFGLHAAAKAGAKVDEKVWPAIRSYYLHHQRGGGWTYHNVQIGGVSASRSMTSAGLVGLAVADKYDKPTDAAKEAFEKGMKAFLAFPDENPKSTGYQFLVSAELGRTTGSPTFKSGDKVVTWYREGAEKLVKKQEADGSWVFGKGIDGAAVLNTAFGLYFLGPPGKE